MKIERADHSKWNLNSEKKSFETGLKLIKYDDIGENLLFNF